MINLDEAHVIGLLSNSDLITYSVVQDQNGIEIENGILTQDCVVEIYIDDQDDQVMKFLISTQYECLSNDKKMLSLKLLKQNFDTGDSGFHKIYTDLMDDLEITVNGKDPSEYILKYVKLSPTYLAYSMTQALDGYIDHLQMEQK